MTDYNDLIHSSRVVMIEFYATWCTHCQRMMSVIAQIRELLDGSVEIYQLDVDKEEAAAEAQNIDSTPTFIVYCDGEQVWRHSGELDGNVLLQKLQQFVG